MSLVSVVATTNFITVMSDGLVTNTQTGAQVETDYEKFSMISDKQFIAYGGHKDIVEFVRDEVGFLNEERDLFTLSSSIRDEIIKNFSPEYISCQMVVGGISEGEVIFHAFNNNRNQRLLTHKPRGGNVEYSFIHSSEVKLNLDLEIQRLASVYGILTPTATSKVQKRLNDYVAKVDSSVNNNTFTLTIRK